MEAKWSIKLHFCIMLALINVFFIYSPCYYSLHFIQHWLVSFWCSTISFYSYHPTIIWWRKKFTPPKGARWNVTFFIFIFFIFLKSFDLLRLILAGPSILFPRSLLKAIWIMITLVWKWYYLFISFSTQTYTMHMPAHWFLFWRIMCILLIFWTLMLMLHHLFNCGVGRTWRHERYPSQQGKGICPPCTIPWNHTWITAHVTSWKIPYSWHGFERCRYHYLSIWLRHPVHSRKEGSPRNHS